jgi:NTP pyrophosphatase (non-canonical NTP hydrolase)
MSVTLRDAQHLCWKNFRKINDHLNPEQGRTWTSFVAISDLVEKTSEMAAIVKSLETSTSPERSGMKDMLATQLSELLYLVFILAEHYGIELEESFMQTVNDRIISTLK